MAEEPLRRAWALALRYREIVAAILIAVLALWWLSVAFGPMRWLSLAAAALAAALAWSGVQRLRFRQGGGGPGVVQVVERRLVYWGPLSGGVFDMDDLVRLDFDPTGRPPHWALVGRDGTILHVPVNAEGADQLFDLFSALPGLPTERMLARLAAPGGQAETLWKSDRLRLH